MSWGDHDNELIRKKLNVAGRKKQAINKPDNEIMANFMGINFDGFQTVSSWTPAKYDEYWEQLMPVVSKIEELGFNFIINQFSANIRPFSYDGNLPLIYENGNTKRDAVYKAALKFIIWHNQQKK